MAFLSKFLGTKDPQGAQPSADPSLQQEQASLDQLRSSLETSYRGPDAAERREMIGSIADKIDAVQSGFEQKASGDARYAEPQKFLEAAINQPDHTQRQMNLVGLISACDQALMKTGVDKGLITDTKKAAEEMLALGKADAELAQQEVKARSASRRLTARRAQQAATEQKKQAEKAAQERREKQEEVLTKAINAEASEKAASGLRTKTGAARVGGQSADEEEFESAEESVQTSLADSNRPAGGGSQPSEGRDGAGQATRAEGNGAIMGGRGAADQGMGTEGLESEAVAEGTSVEAPRSDDELIMFVDGVRRRKRKRRADGSLEELAEALLESGIDEIDILEFIQDPDLLKYFDISKNPRLGQLREKYGEKEIVLWTVTELARGIIAKLLHEKGLVAAGAPPSLRRARSLTEQAVALDCERALAAFLN